MANAFPCSNYRAKKYSMLSVLYKEIAACKKCITDENLAPLIKTIDKFIFLPPRVENGNPRYLFVTMEPTDTWCSSKRHGKKLVHEGFVNFYYSDRKASLRGPILLQFAAQEFLCQPGETYLITDLGKCSMPTDNATKLTSKTRTARFRNCAEFLQQEIEIIRPKRIFIVGASVQAAYKRLDIYPRYRAISSTLFHYSGAGHPAFSRFRNNHLRKYDDFSKQYSDLEERLLSFLDLRRRAISKDLKPNTEAFQRLISCLDYNARMISEGDKSILFYYHSQFRVQKGGKVSFG